MLEVKKLCKSYHTGGKEYQVLHNLNFIIEKGEFVAVMGKSGSGKTTLLNCISQFLPYDSGSILLNGRDLSQLKEEELAEIRNKELGFVFQDFMLLDGLTVFENVCVPRVIGKAQYDEMEKRAKRLLQMFEIHSIADKLPVEISGGQKQRTAVARALMNEPYIILADEPTGNLDSHSSKAVIDAFLKAKKELEATIFMVTHDSYAASYCDRVLVMQDGKLFTSLKNQGNRQKFMDGLLEVLRTLNGGEEDE